MTAASTQPGPGMQGRESAVAPAQPSGSRPADEIALAERAGQAMYRNDAASQGLGMRLVHVGPGKASMEMRVRPDMLNGHRTCHGGFIFALADSTFAFACNSRNQATVASGCTIDFLAPGLAGDVLTARCEEQSLSGRTGVYDVVVTNQDGRRIALFRGRSYRIKGQVVLEAEEPPDA